MAKIFPAQITLNITPDVSGIGPAIAAELRTIADDIDPTPEPDEGVWVNFPDPPYDSTIEMAAQVIYENICIEPVNWHVVGMATRDTYRNAARAVLDVLGGAQ